LEWLRSRDDYVGVEQSVSTESVFSGSDTISRSLVDANKVIGGAEASDGSSEFGHVALKWSPKHEGVGSISLPFDGTEVLLDSNTGSVSEVRQVSGSAFDSRSVVEGLDDRGRGSVVLHASRWSC